MVKPVLSRWLIAITASGIVATRLICPGCVDQHRANSRCDWTDDAGFGIDVSNRGQWRHLVNDAQLAEELAVQYADANFYRWAIPIRTTASGPLQTSDTHADNVRAQVTCLARLDVAIENAHAVTAEQVAAGRAARFPAFDGLVLMSFTPLFVAAAGAVCRWPRALLFADGPLVRTATRVVAAVSVSGVGLLAFRVWWTIFEGMRVGNPAGHMGGRTASWNYWTPSYVAMLFAAGAVVFLVVVVRQQKHAAESM